MTAQPSPEKYRAMLYGVAYTKAMASRPRGGVSQHHTTGSSR